MIGRGTAIGLSLVCALFLCAFAAQSASAKGTTAFTCVKVTLGTGDFDDAHCDTPNPGSKGEFNHEEIQPGVTTELDLTNDKTSHETKVTTPGILRGTLGGITFEIQCTSFTGSGHIKNVEIEKVMQVEGLEGEGAFTNCTVIRPENGGEKRHPCSVKGNEVKLELKGTSITRENLGASKKEMGVEVKPPEKKPLATFTFEGGANCSLNEKKVEVTGTAFATSNVGSNEATESSGATLKFTTAMTSETLKIGAVAAEFSCVITPTMTFEITKTTGNPISLTTTAI